MGRKILEVAHKMYKCLIIFLYSHSGLDGGVKLFYFIFNLKRGIMENQDVISRIQKDVQPIS